MLSRLKTRMTEQNSLRQATATTLDDSVRRLLNLDTRCIMCALGPSTPFASLSQ